MKRKMHEMTVETTKDGDIEIMQPNLASDDQLPVVVSPEQAEVLIKWLTEAIEELRNKKK